MSDDEQRAYSFEPVVVNGARVPDIDPADRNALLDFLYSHRSSSN